MQQIAQALAELHQTGVRVAHTKQPPPAEGCLGSMALNEAFDLPRACMDSRGWHSPHSSRWRQVQCSIRALWP